MDIASIIGLLLGGSLLLIAIAIAPGASFAAFIDYPSMMVVIGGYYALEAATDRLSLTAGSRLVAATGVVATVVSLCVFGTLRRNRDYGSELGMWRDVVAKSPHNARAHLGVGTSIFSQAKNARAAGKPDEAKGAFATAEREFREAIRLRPNYADAQYNLGNSLAEGGKLDEAAQAYRMGIRLRPKHAKSHYNLGNVLKQQGNLDAAIASYRKAVQVKPDHISAHINLGNSLKLQGRYDEAVQQYRRALTINPR